MKTPNFQPLAARMRPKQLSSFVGQTHLLGRNKPLYQAYHHHHIHSMTLWGLPGSGKTTLAMMVSDQINAQFYTISAVLAGVKEIRDIIDKARKHQQQDNQKTVLFIDEIHRFNKSKQDAFLSHVESGLITFPTKIYYKPVARGLEIKIQEKLNRLKTLDRIALKEKDNANHA